MRDSNRLLKKKKVPKVIQLVSYRARTQNQICLSPKLVCLTNVYKSTSVIITASVT